MASVIARAVCTLALVPLVSGYAHASAPKLCGPHPLRWLRGGRMQEVLPDEKDYGKEATGLFSSMRLASLFPAGATLGAAFAIPPVPGETYPLAIGKRLYLLVSLFSLSSSLLAVIYSTAAINRLSVEPPPPATSLRALLDRDFAFLWNGCNSHFYMALLAFTLMIGMRAWTAFACPVFGKVGAFLIGSSFLLMSSALADDGSGSSPCLVLPRYLKLLLHRALAGNVLTIGALLTGVFCVYRTWAGAMHILDSFRKLGAAP